MRKNILLFSLATLLCCTSAKAQLSSNPDKFLGNITTSGQVDFGNERFYTLWNQITCENESKWASVEGRNDQFNWGSDNAYNYAKKNNFPFKFHALIWGSQYPSWLEQMTPEQRYKEIVQWMDKVKEHYPDLKLIDVVNEAVAGHQAGTKYFIEALGGTGETGYDWIIKAFEMAYERWPDAILIYNDFNTFQWNTSQYISLVKTLRNAGAPIDAYGCQSHDLTDCSLSTFKSAMTNLQNSLKMPMYSTEYDIGTTSDSKQLQRYKEQIPYMWEADYCAGVTLWGYIYGRTWTSDTDANGNKINQGHSGIIKDGKDRPAMEWLREYMQTDAAKNAKSPFPGMVKEASVYVKPMALNVEKDRATKITVRAKMRTKSIEKIELYAKNVLIATMTEAPYEATYTPTTTGAQELKAVVTCTDGSTYERYSGITVAKPRTAYKDTPTELPGTLEAENFDTGAEGIAYHDSNSSKEGTGSAYRSDATGVDIEKGGSGYVLGYTHVGEWVEYTVNVKEAGIYAVDMCYSAPEAGAAYSLALNTTDGLKPLTDSKVFVPATGDWNAFKTAHTRCLVPLEAGQQIIRLTFTNGPEYVMNVDKMTFEHINVDENIGISLGFDEEEAMIGMDNILTADVTSEKEVKDVKFYVDGILTETVTENPYKFNYQPTITGQYTITAYATCADNSQSKIASRSIKVVPMHMPFNGIIELPGIIEAENFDMGGEGVTFHDADATDDFKCGYRTDNEGVDIKKTAKGDYVISNTAAGEWYEYSVNINSDGKYTCEVVASSGVAGSSIKVVVGSSENGPNNWTFNIPQKGADTYNTATSRTKRTLTQGKNVIRLYVTGAGCNIDKIVLKNTDADGIEDVTIDASAASNRTYNIAGQHVDETYRGIYIKNGKKYIKR